MRDYRLVHIVFGTAAASLVVTMAGFASIRDGFQQLLVPLAVILFGGGLTAMLLARRSRTGSCASSGRGRSRSRNRPPHHCGGPSNGRFCR